MANSLTQEQIRANNALNANAAAANNSASGFGAVTKTAAALAVGVGLAGKSLGGMIEAVKGGENAYKKLSDSGSSFSNDLIGMNTAAIKSRVNINEFSDLLAKNGRNLAGMGGSVVRGSENFSKMADEFHQQDSALRQLGYTTNEMNDMLSDTIGASRTIKLSDDNQRKIVNESTMVFAKELDLTSKLTGKNRRELAEQMQDKTKAVRRDAAMNLATANMDATTKLAVKANMLQLTAQAGATGMQQAFDELVETGTVYSETAANQAAMGGEAFEELRESARLAKEGHIEESNARMLNAKALAVKNQNDPAHQLAIATSGMTGALGASISDTAIALQPMVDGANSAAESFGIVLKTNQDYVDQMKRTIKDLTKSQDSFRLSNEKGKEGIYENVGQVKEALITVDSAIDAAAASLAKGVDKLTPSLNKLAAEFTNIVPSQSKIEPEIDKHLNNIEALVKSNSPADMAGILKNYALDTGVAVTKSLKDEVVPAIKDGIKEIITEFTGKTFSPAEEPTKPNKPNPNEPEKFSTGTMGVYGKTFGDFGQGTLVMAHGKEAIMPESHVDQLVSGTYKTGYAESTKQLNGLLKTLPGSMSVAPIINNSVTNKIDTISNDKDDESSIRNSISSAMGDFANGVIKSFPDDQLNNDELKSTMDNVVSSFPKNLLNDKDFKSTMDNVVNSYPKNPLNNDDFKSTMDNVVNSYPKNPLNNDDFKSTMDKVIKSFPENPLNNDDFKSTMDNVVNSYPENPLNNDDFKSTMDNVTNGVIDAIPDKSNESSIGDDISSAISGITKIFDNDNKNLSQNRDNVHYVTPVPNAFPKDDPSKHIYAKGINPNVLFDSMVKSQKLSTIPTSNIANNKTDKTEKELLALKDAYNEMIETGVWNEKGAEYQKAELSKKDNLVRAQTIELSKNQLANIVPEISNKDKVSNVVEKESALTTSVSDVNKVSTPQDKVNRDDFSIVNGIPHFVDHTKLPEKKLEDKNSTKPDEQKTKTQEKKQEVATKQTDVMSQMLNELKNLNGQMTKLINQHDDLGNKHIRATKDSQTNNIFPQG